MAMSDDEFMRIKEYVDKKLEDFRNELLDYLSTIKSGDIEKTRKELIRLLTNEVERLRGELLSEVRSGGDLGLITRRLEELSREVEAIKQLASKQGDQQVNINELITEMKHEVALVESRLRQFVINKVNEVEERRRRKAVRRALILLAGTTIGIAVITAVIIELVPWLLPLIIIAVIVLLRR